MHNDPLPPGLLPGGRFDHWQRRRPRYVLMDVDGTLLGASDRATAEVERAVREARQAGLLVGLATGRMPGACRSLADQLGVTGPHVLHNGAEVRAGGRSVRRWPLSTQQARALVAVCAQHGLYAELYVGDGYHVTDRRPEAAAHWDLLGAEPDGLAADLDLSETEVLKATVVLFAGAPIDPLLALLDEAGLAGGVAHSPALPEVTFCNVTDPAADKGEALLVAAEQAGAGVEEVVAVGDGLNDIPMLAVAGTAIAMGQAAPAVQQAAHLVVPEVDADGVAHALDAAVGWSGP